MGSDLDTWHQQRHRGTLTALAADHVTRVAGRTSEDGREQEKKKKDILKGRLRDLEDMAVWV